VDAVAGKRITYRQLTAQVS